MKRLTKIQATLVIWQDEKESALDPARLAEEVNSRLCPEYSPVRCVDALVGGLELVDDTVNVPNLLGKRYSLEIPEAIEISEEDKSIRLL